MEIFLLIVVVVVVLVIMGKLKGDPDIEKLDTAGLKREIWVTQNWINNYHTAGSPLDMSEKYQHKQSRLKQAIEQLNIVTKIGNLESALINNIVNDVGNSAFASMDELQGRIKSEEAWIEKYKSMPYGNQQLPDIKKQYEEKQLSVKQLQLDFMKCVAKAGGKNPEDTLIPIMERSIELMKTGMSEEAAGKQASDEFVQRRDAGLSVQPGKSMDASSTLTQTKPLPAPSKKVTNSAINEPSEGQSSDAFMIKMLNEAVANESDEEKEVNRIRREKIVARTDAMARNIDVELVLNNTLLEMKRLGYPLSKALTSSIRPKYVTGILSEIDQLKADGLTETDAIRAALNSFSTPQ